MTAMIKSSPAIGAISRVVTVDGWTLDVTADEPRIRDIDRAERAGLKQPRDIRKVIERCREELEEFGLLDVRVHCARTSMPRGGYQEREVTEFWLNEHQATTVLLQLRTLPARRLRAAVVKVFVAYRRGQLATPQQVPVLASSPLLGDSQLRTEFAARCTTAATKLGVGIHRIHGAVRQQLRVVGIYQLPAVLYATVRELVDAWTARRLPLPAASRRPRAARAGSSAATQAQTSLPLGEGWR